MSHFHPITANLPYDREKVLSELQYVLDTKSEAEMLAFRASLKSLGQETQENDPPNVQEVTIGKPKKKPRER